MSLTVTLREAEGADRDVLVGFARAFALEDGHDPMGPAQERAILGLIGRPDLGRVLMLSSGVVDVGYAVLCYGYSVEYGGRDAFLDELYVDPAHRGLGLARSSLGLLADMARADGAKALHLEVMAGNERAARLYLDAGWVDRDSRFMSLWLDGDAGEP